MGRRRLPVSGPFTLNNSEVVRDAAVGGLGIAVKSLLFAPILLGARSAIGRERLMSVFDMLAERRYLDWEKKVSAPGYQPPPPVSKTAVRKSYEGYVYGEVLAHLDKVAEADNAQQQAEYLRKARQLELQLSILLEKRKMPHAMATLRTSIKLRRQGVLERASNTPSSARAKPVS